MSEVQKLSLAIACITAILTTAASQVRAQRQSTNANTLQEWAYILETRNPAWAYTNAQLAVRHLGTNAIPTLLEWLSYNPQTENIRCPIRRPRRLKTLAGLVSPTQQ